MFTNTVGGFKKWSRTYPPLTLGTNIKYYKKGNNYCSIQRIFVSPLCSFSGVTQRTYDERYKTFELSNDSDLFDNEIKEYDKVHENNS